MDDIKNICLKRPDKGRAYLRNAVVLAYFVQKPAHEIADAVAAMLDDYLSQVPAGALKWVIPSSSSEQWKPVGPKTVASIKKSIAPAASRARDLTSFHFTNDQGAAPEFEFMFVGKPKGLKSPPGASLIQMVFPIESVQATRVDDLVEHVRRLSSMVDFTYGYCSPALTYSEVWLIDAYTAIRGLALRHPGYDVQNNMPVAEMLGNRVRGARWITLLGAKPLEALGGAAALKRALKSPISVEELGSGVMIRAGRQPEIGDVNRHQDTPALRQLAKVLEPITKFGEEDLIFTKLDSDEAFLRRWERRFLDPRGSTQ